MNNRIYSLTVDASSSNDSEGGCVTSTTWSQKYHTGDESQTQMMIKIDDGRNRSTYS